MDPEIAVDQDIDAAPLNIDPPAGLERDDAPERALPDPEAAAGEHAHAAGARRRHARAAAFCSTRVRSY
jgi:hypothetical protein